MFNDIALICIIFFYHFYIFLSDSDDGNPEEFTNVYKLSREEYFWNMYNSSSFSECWEILKEGMINKQTDRQTGRLLTQQILKYLFFIFFAIHFFYDSVLLFFFTVWHFLDTTGYNNSSAV